MQNPNQIGRKRKSVGRGAQARPNNPSTQLSGAAKYRQPEITSNLSEILDEVAGMLGKDRRKVAGHAIELYAEMAKQNPDLAEAQPTVHFTDATLFLEP